MVCLLAAVAVAVGCQNTDKIETYTAPKDPPRGEIASAAGAIAPAPATSPNPAALTDPTDRMLVAIVPDGGQAWFFKVVGPLAAIDEQEKAITDFFATLQPAAGKPQPSWQLPAGWAEKPGAMLRLATIVIPTTDKPLELAVTSLNWSGQPVDVLANVNRWRDQMQLPPIGEPQLGESLREQKAGNTTLTIVDLRGRFPSGGMMAPFAGGGPPGGLAGGGNPPPPGTVDELPAGHPPIGATTASPHGTAGAADASSVVPTFAAPASWKVVPTPEGGMRKAEFDVADGEKTAKVTMIDFSARAGPMIADPLANVNRWRSEVGLDPLQQDALEANIEKIDVDGQPATYTAIIPDAAQPEQSQSVEATLGALVPSGDRIWFIKLKGDRDLVTAEQERFKEFLKSVRFNADRGAPDGN
jgi:hypothetical protein